jgi:hypothetical protein
VKIKVTQGSLFCLALPCLFLLIVFIIQKSNSIRTEKDISNKTFHMIDMIVENLKQGKIKESFILISENKKFYIYFPESDKESNLRLINLEACICFLFRAALDLRDQKDIETAILFEDTANQLIALSQKVQDPRPWVQINLKQLPRFKSRYKAQLLTRNRYPRKPVQ